MPRFYVKKLRFAKVVGKNKHIFPYVSGIRYLASKFQAGMAKKGPSTD